MQKNIVLLLISFFILCSCKPVEKEENNKISVTLKTKSEETTNATFRGFYNLWERIDRINRDDKNTINFTKKVSNSEMLMIGAKGIYASARIFLDKGDRISITVKDKGFIIEGKDRVARQNRLLQKIQIEKDAIAKYYSKLAYYNRGLAKGRKIAKPQELNLQAAYQKIDKMLLDFKKKNKKYSENFVRYIQIDNKYFRIKNELEMPAYKVKTYHPFSADNLQKMKMCLDDSKYEVSVLSLNYNQVLNAYIDYLRINDPKELLEDGKNWLQNEINVANYIPNSFVKKYIIAHNLMALYYYNAKRSEYLEIVQKYGGQWSEFILDAAKKVKGKPGKKVYDTPANYPVLEGVDVEGKKVSLADFKGQWVYVDIWATWCGPCNFEIPYLNELKHRMKDYNVKFIGVSVDKDEDRTKWTKLLKLKNMGGIQIQNPSRDAVYSPFAVMGIPHFAIISPDGKLYLNKAPTPSTGIPERLLKDLAGKIE